MFNERIFNFLVELYIERPYKRILIALIWSRIDGCPLKTAERALEYEAAKKSK